MRKTLIIWSVLLAITIAIIVALEFTLPKKIDWRETYSWNTNRPYDLSIFQEEWIGKYKVSDVEECSKSFYEYYTKDYKKSDNKSLFVYIGGYFEIDSLSYVKLFEFVEEGNDAFISSSAANESFYNALGKSTDYEINWEIGKDTLLLNLYNQEASVQTNLTNKKYYFISNRKNYEAIGWVNSKSAFKIDTLLNFIKIPLGKGNVYLHTAPQVFTNYYLLHLNSSAYVNAVLSYPSHDKILMYRGRNIYQSAFDVNNDYIKDNPLRFILMNKSLRWAWYFLLLGSLLWVIVYAKRRQRVIPEEKSIANNTVDFVKTISNLYYDTKDYAFLIDKKLIYFFERLKNQYMIDNANIDENWEEFVSAKLNVERKNVNQFSEWYHSYRRRDIATEKDLIELNTILENIENNKF